jgi:hypothetical protein
MIPLPIGGLSGGTEVVGPDYVAIAFVYVLAGVSRIGGKPYAGSIGHYRLHDTLAMQLIAQAYFDESACETMPVSTPVELYAARCAGIHLGFPGPS